MFPERYYSTCFMEDPFLDQSSEVTCSSLHSLVGPELSLLTPSCGLFLSFASHVCDTDFDTWKAFHSVFIFLFQNIQSTYVRFLPLLV